MYQGKISARGLEGVVVLSTHTGPYAPCSDRDVQNLAPSSMPFMPLAVPLSCLGEICVLLKMFTCFLIAFKQLISICYISRVANGVKLFKESKHEEAMKCFDQALQMHATNVEAIVARGAL